MGIEIAIIVALIFFAITVIVGILFDSTVSYFSEDVKVDAVKTPDESIVEISNIGDYISSTNFVPLIILAIAIPVMLFSIKMIPYVLNYLSEKRFLKKSMENSRVLLLGSKLKKNDDGYKTAQYIVAATDVLESISKDETETSSGGLKDAINKMDEILNMYLADREAFAMVMYKYEDTFKIMCETINRYVLSNQKETNNFNKVINDLIEIPHEEIVKEEGYKWLYDEGKYERDVIRDMKAMQKK